MDSTIALKERIEKLELRIRILEIRNRALEEYVERRESEKVENASLLREAQQEIERLNAVVTHYEHQIASYSQRCATATDVGECFEFEMVGPQTSLDNTVSVSAPNVIMNEPNECLDFPLNIEIKKELTDETDNASLWSRKVAREKFKRFAHNFQPENVENGNRNGECEQDDGWSVFSGDEGRESGTEGEEDDNDAEYEELSEESKPCRWIQDGGKVCGRVLKDSSERTKHLVEEHLGHPGPDGYVCQWDGCKRNLWPIKTRNNMTIHLKCHSCQKYLRCNFKGCNMVYRYMSSLKWHRNTHRSKDPVKCTFPGCTKVFKKIHEMTQHLRAHEERKPRIVPNSAGLFVCPVPDCLRTFKLEGPFQKHVEKHELDEDSN